MKTLKAVGLAGSLVVAALVGGTLISVVSASPSPAPGGGTGVVADEVDTTASCDLWRQTFADELGVAVDDLTPAARAAAMATIDQAVADGDLPQDVADRMKERIQAADGDGCRLLGAGFMALGRHAARADFRLDWVTAAAGALAMDPGDLVGALRGGDSLQDVAEAQGVDYGDVSQAILDAATADLDALVAAGRITQERADLRLANLADRLEAGEFPPVRGAGTGFGRGMRHGPAQGGQGAGNGIGAFSS
jgi:hypothetical protein